eukprot:gb/GEZN01011040.1/.p1 GENE.gb/GEZN01011040.1/~~gb/GEZN01011040.1/.p1  ORF type:complete len:375 (+),score=24.95 gb/GEZN01011040.1/:31-1155(+)
MHNLSSQWFESSTKVDAKWLSMTSYPRRVSGEWGMIGVAFIAVVLALQGLNHVVLTGLWASIASHPLVRHPMAEAYISVLSFYVWTHVWIFLYGKTKGKGVSNKQWHAFHVSELRLWFVAAFYFLAIWLFHRFVMNRRSLDLAPPSVSRVLLEVAFGIVGYDFIFFWIHRHMHRNNVGSHHKHHEEPNVMPWHVANHDMLDAFLQVYVNVLVQQYGPFGQKHDLSRLVHNILITYMLVEIHTPVDTWFSLHNLFPSLVGGSKFHLRHHRDGRYHYQQFFFYLDAWFGTLPPSQNWSIKASSSHEVPSLHQVPRLSRTCADHSDRISSHALGTRDSSDTDKGTLEESPLVYGYVMGAIWIGSLWMTYHGMAADLL